MKQTVLHLMWKAGAFAPFRLARRAQGLILCYHRFSRAAEPGKTSALLLAENVRYLKKHYTLIPLAELATRLQEGKSLRGLAVLTIDDGYCDAYDIAFPVLRHHNVPATLFVCTAFLSRQSWLWTDKLRYLACATAARSLTVTLNGQTQPIRLTEQQGRLAAAAQVNEKLKAIPEEEKERAIERLAQEHDVALPALPPEEYRAITWEQARELDAHGVAIESHTVTHPMLTQVPHQRLPQELQGARQKLAAELGREAQLFCYPDGAYNAQVRAAVAEAGYRCAVTMQHGFATAHSDLLTLPRVHGETDQAHFVQATSGFEAFKLRWIRQAPWPQEEVTG